MGLFKGNFRQGVFLCLMVLSAQGLCAAGQKKESVALSRYIMAMMYDDLGQIDQAIQQYKKALWLDSRNNIVRLNLAVAYLKKGQVEQAVKELNTAAKIEPDAVEPHAVLAVLFSLQNKPDQANREYEISLKNAAKANPQNIDIYRNLGQLYTGEKKFDAAIEAFGIVLALSPQDSTAHFYLANLYELKGEKEKAEAQLKKALELKPDYHEALNYLGFFYAQENKNLDQAEALVKKALEFAPENGAYLDSLGWVYFKKGKNRQALEILQRAAVLIEDPVVFEHLGDAYIKAGDKENAKISWEKSLKLDPQQDSVKEKLKDALH